MHSFFGIFTPHADSFELITHVGELWLVVGLAGIAFRVVQLFVLKDLRTGLVWATKIATDPFHDIKLYHRAPIELLRRQPAAQVLCDEIDDPIAVEVSKSGV